MKAKLTKPPEGREVGEIVDHKEAHLLVALGIAEPADEECQAKADIAESRRENAMQQAAKDREQRLAQNKRRAEAALKARQNTFAKQLGVEAADDAKAVAAEKRG